MVKKTLFNKEGVHCVVDGQFGSTGKGALTAWLAEKARETNLEFRGAIYSGGPNSGHTFYHEGEKHVLKQLPTFAVATTLMGGNCAAYLSAGAVIDPIILFEEAERYPQVKIYIHPNAAIVDQFAREAEWGTGAPGIASTLSGTGGALMLKIARHKDAVWGGWNIKTPPNVTTMNHNLHPEEHPYFMEVAQGFSLGINSHFYPHVTSRECTVMQGLADARVPPRLLARTYMTIRTFPIRVGNTEEGHSGNWYDDQVEIDWKDLGVDPEWTTVTKRIRRVATFSWNQFQDALRANDPDFVFVNFLNYLDKERQDEFLFDIAGAGSFGIVAGQGPKSEDIYIIR
jgi:adenylosuccinate synthase